MIHSSSKSRDGSQGSYLSLVILTVYDFLPVLLKHLFVPDCSVWLQVKLFADDVVDFEEQRNKTVVWQTNVKAH